ncbi:protein of unknown function [Pseudodesulfovibrio piezophilus C1TLV30]|uniref:Uncharacterized protein n=1 Tax=Pseudodesulfovibrio piezophilus (strain DSM 21447 / JCM 15486 / C1TLV30) TaxID=1322246 RepID=M1WV43_PSEP2|nr:protein of unknown function [Pseudodesulfovibrio piezophilus C1TLV30]
MCHCTKRTNDFHSIGDVAQLGERCLRKAEVESSNLFVSTKKDKGFQVIT